MAQFIADKRDMEFVLYEQMDLEGLAKAERYTEFNRKTCDLILNEARNLAVKEILPTNKEGDSVGAQLENGRVKVPPCFHKPYKAFCEGDWIAMTDDPEVGGQGMPVTLAQAAGEYFSGANTAFVMYPMLCHGTGKIIETIGTPEQKKMCLKKLYKGEWGGSMVLTEPGAGSDLGLLTTSAKDNGDGTYSISGQKIFITAADQDLTPNIVYPVLARIEGAPAGTRGISLFLVFKYRVNPDGSLGEDNDVQVTAIEEKMGIHGSATCQVTFGGKGGCVGTLLGPPNKGMRGMFLMMNEERLNVGMQALSLGSAAYLYAVNYARERIQGKNLLKFMDESAPSVAIIEHPDVKRMLMNMKVYIEGMRSLCYFVGRCFDLHQIAPTEEERAYNLGLVELMVPIVKAYCSDKSFDVCVSAMQVYGGYGYCQDYPVEQLTRDCKITGIYEGANGIQAMDLLARQLGKQNGKVFMNFLAEIGKTAAAAKAVPGLDEYAARVEEAAGKLAELAMHLGKLAMAFNENTLQAFSAAYPFLEIMGDVIVAWMQLWRATVAKPKLEAILKGATGEDKKALIAKNREAAFYDGQVKGCEYFINSILPITFGKMAAVKGSTSTVMDMDDASFGGK
ncbi:MAG: acyl-CoA dehydrogenase [Deltaproteobacteria bacterium]|nr:acyl-CoA dehydrogenase [Deltaproteobacteria bacterium]